MNLDQKEDANKGEAENEEEDANVTEIGQVENISDAGFNKKNRVKKSFKHWCKNKAKEYKKKFEKKSLTFQVCSCLGFFLTVVAVFLCAILVVGVFFMMNLTYEMLDEKIYTSNLENLAREVMGEMDVFKNMSHRFIEKDEWLMTGVLGVENISSYPLDWTQLDVGIPKFSDVSADQLTESELFGNNSIAKDQMTYILVNNDTDNDFTEDQLKRINILNSVWNKINLVRLGYEFDVDVTSTFFMIKDIVNDKQIVATFPGQNVNVTDFTNYDFYNESRSKPSEYITITLQDDPFDSGIPKVIGY